MTPAAPVSRHRGRQRDHARDQHDGRPVDAAVRRLGREHPEQDERPRPRQPGDGRRDDARSRGRRSCRRGRDRAAGAAAPAARPGAGRSSGESTASTPPVARVGLDRVPGALEQQRCRPARASTSRGAELLAACAGSRATTRSPDSVTMPGNAVSPISGERGGMITSARPEVGLDQRGGDVEVGRPAPASSPSRARRVRAAALSSRPYWSTSVRAWRLRSAGIDLGRRSGSSRGPSARMTRDRPRQQRDPGERELEEAEPLRR